MSSWLRFLRGRLSEIPGSSDTRHLEAGAVDGGFISVVFYCLLILKHRGCVMLHDKNLNKKTLTDLHKCLLQYCSE